jgi:hypothetical protein
MCNKVYTLSLIAILLLLGSASGCSFSKKCPRCEKSVTSDVGKESIKEEGMCVDCSWKQMERDVRREAENVMRSIGQ